MQKKKAIQKQTEKLQCSELSPAVAVVLQITEFSAAPGERAFDLNAYYRRRFGTSKQNVNTH